MSGFMMQNGRLIICGNAAKGLGDSMYQGQIWLGGEADENDDRKITGEELHGYVAEHVGRQAARLGREQSPELFGERDRVLVRY